MTRIRAERGLEILTLVGGLPAVVVSLVLLTFADWTTPARWSVVVFVVGAWLLGAVVLRNRVAFRLRTISNLLAAVREGDYSFRVRGGRRDDALGEVIIELNLLAQTLRDQRLGEVEATALLGKVMAEVDVAVLAFDDTRQLRLANPAGERLLGGGRGLLGRSVEELGLGECFTGPTARTLPLRFAGQAGRWELRRGVFRQHGRPMSLLVLSDVSRALRAEELAAWRRLIRVIGHELNNSLAPIKSLAASLEKLALREPLPGDWRADMASGLRVIGSRSEALNRFMSAYALLAKMPPPAPVKVDVGAWVRRVAGLENRLKVNVVEGRQVSVLADPDQLEQALINLIRNAVDASLSSGGGVAVGWESGNESVAVWITDEGPGLPESANLFVPFFTTKPGGSGIGLVLCRQVAEGHGGSVQLSNREDGPGCRAVLRIPVTPANHP